MNPLFICFAPGVKVAGKDSVAAVGHNHNVAHYIEDAVEYAAGTRIYQLVGTIADVEITEKVEVPAEPLADLKVGETWESRGYRCKVITNLHQPIDGKKASVVRVEWGMGLGSRDYIVSRCGNYERSPRADEWIPMLAVGLRPENAATTRTATKIERQFVPAGPGCKGCPHAS